MLQYADLGRDVGISAPTAKQWLSLLVTSGIVCLVEPWHSNTLKRMIKAPKLCFLDTGLCAYLTRWTSPEALEAGAMSGPMFETFVVSEIMESANPGKDAIAAYGFLKEAGKPLGQGAIVCCTLEYLPLDAKNSIVPWR